MYGRVHAIYIIDTERCTVGIGEKFESYCWANNYITQPRSRIRLNSRLYRVNMSRLCEEQA